MAQIANSFLTPPSQTETMYSDATAGPLWRYNRDTLRLSIPEWPQLYVTDGEAAHMSGIPERSLLTIQTGGVVRTTKAPVGHGTQRRVWSLSQVAVAAVVAEMKDAKNLNYKAASELLLPSVIHLNVLFAHFVKVDLRKRYRLGSPDENFRAGIKVSSNGVVAIYMDLWFTRGIDEYSLFSRPNEKEDDIITRYLPVSMWDGKRSVSLDYHETRNSEKLIAKLDESRHATSINLRPIWNDLRDAAQAMRKDAD